MPGSLLPNPGTAQASLQVQLEQALALHRQGRFDEAEALYRALLLANPRHFDAAHLLGVSKLQRGDPSGALWHFDIATRIDPDIAELQNNRGLALMGLERCTEALGCFDKAARLQPSLVHALANRGSAQHALGRCEEAIASYDQALALRRNPELLTNRGHALISLNRFQEAIANLNEAIYLAPGLPAAFNNRGLAFRGLNRFDDAVADFDKAIALNAAYAEAHNNRGIAMKELNHFEEALASYDRALALNPNYAEAYNNRGVALQDQERFEDALASFDRALAIKPAYLSALNNRGAALRALNRIEEAIASFDRVVSMAPSDAEAAYNRGVARLTLGQFAQGWEDYEHRWKSPKLRKDGRPDVDPKQFAANATRGTVRDKRVLVVTEQGVGDEIMFASIVPDLVRDARSVSLECDGRLASLFARSFPDSGIIPKRAPPLWDPRTSDVVLPIGNLGRLYRNSVEAFPERDRYLVPDEAISASWRARLSNLGRGLKVGISWRGGINKTRRNARSIPLERWRPILSLPDVHFVSLQYGEPRDEIAAANVSLSTPIACFAPEEIEDFDQLAGLVAALDLVISVQTALVHLSGAVGQRCWVMVPFAAEWRYGARTASMPWYRSVRLHRQSMPGDWAAVIARVAADLTLIGRDGRDRV